MVEQPAILLIEDEARLRDNLQTLLQSAGYHVTTAQNGAEGIKQLRKGPFDLVLTDLVMPEVDGFQVLEYLKAYSPETVVVVMTAYVSAGSVIDALRKGAYDYLTKPFEFDLMKATIARAGKSTSAKAPSALHEQTGTHGRGTDRGPTAGEYPS
jgi:two-component system response regulator PilR (NtrC family)